MRDLTIRRMHRPAKLPVLIICFLLLSTIIPAYTAFAMNIEEEIFTNQQKWETLLAEHYYALSEQERFVANSLHDAIGYATSESTELFLTLSKATTLGDMKALIGSGYFDVSNLKYEDSKGILGMAQDVLSAANLDIPPCYFVQHFKIGMYNREEGWHCYLGYMTAEEPVFEYELYFSGDPARMMTFESVHTQQLLIE